METALTCFFCGRLPPATASEHFRCNNASPSRHVHFSLPPSFVIGTHRLIRNATNTNETKVVSSTNVKSRRRRRRSGFVDKTCQTREVEEGILHQNGDPIGKKDLGKSVIRWIRDSMRAMASDLAAAELEGGEESLSCGSSWDLVSLLLCWHSHISMLFLCPLALRVSA